MNSEPSLSYETAWRIGVLGWLLFIAKNCFFISGTRALCRLLASFIPCIVNRAPVGVASLSLTPYSEINILSMSYFFHT